MEENKIILCSLKPYEIVWDNIKNIEDVKSLLKGLNITINIVNGNIPETLKESFEKGLIKEIIK